MAGEYRDLINGGEPLGELLNSNKIFSLLEICFTISRESTGWNVFINVIYNGISQPEVVSALSPLVHRQLDNIQGDFGYHHYCHLLVLLPSSVSRPGSC